MGCEAEANLSDALQMVLMTSSQSGWTATVVVVLRLLRVLSVAQVACVSSKTV